MIGRRRRDTAIMELSDCEVEGLLQVAAFEAAQAHDVVVAELRYEERNGGLLDGGKRRLSVNLALLAQCGHDARAVAQVEPLGELFATQAFGAGGDEDDTPGGLHGLIGVVQRFVGLNEIARPGRGGNDEIGGPFEWHDVEVTREGAGFAMGRVQLAGEDAGDVAGAVQNGMQDAVHAGESRGFEHIFGDGISVEHADADRWVERVLRGMQVHGVVVRNRFRRGESGHDGLAASAEPSEIMQHNRSGDDDPIGFVEPAVDFDWRPARRGPERDMGVGIVGFVATHAVAKTIKYGGPQNFALFLFRGRAVRSRGKEDVYGFVGNPTLRECGD